MRNAPYFMLIKPEGDARRYCGRCELAAAICACDDADAYDAQFANHKDAPHG